MNVLGEASKLSRYLHRVLTHTQPDRAYSLTQEVIGCPGDLNKAGGKKQQHPKNKNNTKNLNLLEKTNNKDFNPILEKKTQKESCWIYPTRPNRPNSKEKKATIPPCAFALRRGTTTSSTGRGANNDSQGAYDLARGVSCPGNG